MADPTDVGSGIREPSVKMCMCFLYFVCRRLLKSILPCAGQAAFDHGVLVWRFKEIREERGNQGPRGEVFSSLRKGGGVTLIVAKKERALSTKGVWA